MSRATTTLLSALALLFTGIVCDLERTSVSAGKPRLVDLREALGQAVTPGRPGAGSGPTPRPSIGIRLLGQARGKRGTSIREVNPNEASHIIDVVNGVAACRKASPEEVLSTIPRDDDPGTPVNDIPRKHKLGARRLRAANPSAQVTPARLTFDLRALEQLRGDADKEVIIAAFERAAAAWSNRIKTPVTVVLGIDYGVNTARGDAFLPRTLASTYHPYVGFDYPEARRILAANSSGALEASIMNALPQSVLPTDTGTGSMVALTYAQSRAFGMPVTTWEGGLDATVSFNKNVLWDFNPDDGIGFLRHDFVAAATHEIGHALGFVSLNGEASAPPTILDMFRFRPGMTAENFTTAQRVMTTGGEQVYFTGQQFKVGGVKTNELRLSTGGPKKLEDGVWESGHWKDDDDPSSGVYVGIMDPSLSSEKHYEPTENDFWALEILGWNLVGGTFPPQPPVQTDASGVEGSPRGNPTQTLGTSLSGSFSSLEVKYEGSCRPNSQHFYSLHILEFPDSSYSFTPEMRAFLSVTQKVSSRCGTQIDVWTASDFISTITFDPYKFYGFMLVQLDAAPRGSEQDVYPQGCYDTRQEQTPSLACRQSSNLKDLYFALTLNPTISPPAVASLRPALAASGAKIIINGSGFASAQGAAFATFGGVRADIYSWSDTQVVALAPAGPQGTVPVSVTTSLGMSNAVDFTYYPSPAECQSVVRQQSGLDFCGEGLDVPNNCGGYSGGTAQLHKFAQVFTSQFTASPGKLALKIGGFFGNPSGTVNYKARIYDTADPNTANGSNLVAVSDDLNVSTGALGQNILINFPGGAPQLLQNHTYTWIVEVTGGNIGDNGLKGSNDDGNNPGGAAYYWDQYDFVRSSNSYVPKYYYFVLCGQTSAPTPTPTPEPTPAVSPGQLVISEFRLRGPGPAPTPSVALQAADEFVEIYNNTDGDIIVATTDGSPGFALAASDGAVRFVIPNGTVLPARGHFLGVNSAGYSLSSYAAGDATYSIDVSDNTGIALFRTANPANFTSANRLDAAGSTVETNPLYREGIGYLPLVVSTNVEHSYYRDTCGFVEGQGCVTAGVPKDTDDNAADFLYVSVDGADAGAGRRLGAPGPENLAAPVNRTVGVAMSLLDATKSNSHPPNRSRAFKGHPNNNSTFGTLSIRRRVINNTGAPVTRLRFRVVDLTTFPASAGTADLRVLTSSWIEVTNVEDAETCVATGAGVSPCTVTVSGTVVESPPAQPNGGGLNSSLSLEGVTLATPLQPGASVSVQFLLGIQQTGTFRFYVITETLP
jgi:hypothetical protein